MLQPGSYVHITDKTGATIGQIIKILGPRRKRRVATVGDKVLLSIIWENVYIPKKHNTKFKNKFKKGSIHRAIILRTCVNRIITTGAWIKYGQNAVCLVSSKGVPLSKRSKGPVSRELCLRMPAIGCISRCVI